MRMPCEETCACVSSKYEQKRKKLSNQACYVNVAQEQEKHCTVLVKVQRWDPEL